MKMINNRQIFTDISPEQSAAAIGGKLLITLDPTDYSYTLTREIDGIFYSSNGFSDLGSLIGSLGARNVGIELLDNTLNSYDPYGIS